MQATVIVLWSILLDFAYRHSTQEVERKRATQWAFFGCHQSRTSLFYVRLEFIGAIRLILWDDGIFRCDDNNASQLIFTSFSFRHNNPYCFEWNYSLFAHTAIFFHSIASSHPHFSCTFFTFLFLWIRMCVSHARTLWLLQIILTLLLEVFNCCALQHSFDSQPNS